MLSQPWYLLGFRFLIIAKMSSTLIFNDKRASFALRSLERYIDCLNFVMEYIEKQKIYQR